MLYQGIEPVFVQNELVSWFRHSPCEPCHTVETLPEGAINEGHCAVYHFKMNWDSSIYFLTVAADVSITCEKSTLPISEVFTKAYVLFE